MSPNVAIRARKMKRKQRESKSVIDITMNKVVIVMVATSLKYILDQILV